MNIPKSMLPEVKPSSCLYGYTNEGILGGRIPTAALPEISRRLCSGSAVLSREKLKILMAQGVFFL